jgi:hypothetical protein
MILKNVKTPVQQQAQVKQFLSLRNFQDLPPILKLRQQFFFNL